MKSLKIFLLITAAITCSFAHPGFADTYSIDKGYTVSIHGTSNLHDWNENVTDVHGNGLVSWNSNGSFDLNGLNIKMEVRSIKSTEGAIMNNNTYKALKAGNNPEITIALISPIRSIPAGTHVIPAQINLTIAGVTKTFVMRITANSQSQGNIAFEGSKMIKMTDFGIKPPVALFGTLKTGDYITINFKTVFVLSK